MGKIDLKNCSDNDCRNVLSNVNYFANIINPTIT